MNSDHAGSNARCTRKKLFRALKEKIQNSYKLIKQNILKAFIKGPNKPKGFSTFFSILLLIFKKFIFYFKT